MLCKVVIIKKLEEIKDNLPKEVYQEALNIATVLDDKYACGRDLDEDDGGFVLILESVRDISEAADWYTQLDKYKHEYLNLVKCEDTNYINDFYLINNEFGVNVFLHKAIASMVLLDNLEE